MDKRTIEKNLNDIRSLRLRLQRMGEELLAIETDLDKWASEMPDEGETF